MSLRLAALAFAILIGGPAPAQTDLALGGLNADPDAPVEITADGLTVDQDSGRAVFAGNVVIGQGDLRIAAGRVEVIYDEQTGDISSLSASGGVTIATATEAAESAEADYDLTTGILSLSGDVLLTQGPGALSADRMTVNLSDGTARMVGNVRTVLQREGN